MHISCHPYAKCPSIPFSRSNIFFFSISPLFFGHCCLESCHWRSIIHIIFKIYSIETIVINRVPYSSIWVIQWDKTVPTTSINLRHHGSRIHSIPPPFAAWPATIKGLFKFRFLKFRTLNFLITDFDLDI